jgi:hypothetical protein
LLLPDEGLRFLKIEGRSHRTQLTGSAHAACPLFHVYAQETPCLSQVALESRLEMRSCGWAAADEESRTFLRSSDT